IWLGPYSTCDQCCLLSSGGTPEGEPLCGTNYVDTYNGGCDSNPPVFQPIGCGDRIAGQSGTYLFGSPPVSRRDTDWFSFALGQNATIEVRLRAEFAVTLWLVHAGSGAGACDPNNVTEGYWHLFRPVQGPRCTDIVATSRCMRPGEYYVVVMPTADAGVPCGADYDLLVICTPGCEPCEVECPPGALHEQEPCGQNTNGGCNVTPNAFEPIQVNTQYCGTLWASNGRADEDWFVFELTQPSACELYWEAEFPAFPSLVTCQETGTYGARCGCSHWGARVGPCQAVRITGYMLPPGRYFFTPIMSDDTGHLYYGYPCGTEDTYTFKLHAEPGGGCPNFVVCETGQFGAPEGEPECHDYYIDTYNGGCDAALQRFQTIDCNLPQGGICAKSGTFRRNDPYNPRGADSDWYQLVLTQPTRFTLRIWPEFPLSFQVLRGPTCPGQIIEDYEFGGCVQAPDTITRCFSPGTYWFRFAPTHANLETACSANYAFLLTCETPCTPCVVHCPAGSLIEQEYCGEDRNGGCNSTPPAFEDLACGATKCGWTWAEDGQRDTDWYRLTTGGPHTLIPAVDTEVPLLLLVITGSSPGQPRCDDLVGYQVAGIRPCNGGQEITSLPALPAGEYWLVLMPADASGGGIFSNYPCGGGLNR
ncbi:MAG: hypothetical protein AB1716_08450, partial [Planctomycetota bacterium]